LRLDISKAWNSVRFVIEKGMYPVKLLPTRFRSLSCVRLPIVEGIVPEKGPRQSSNLSKELRYPMEGGLFPENLVRYSSNLLQRLFGSNSGSEPSRSILPAKDVTSSFGKLKILL